jgi:alpha-glucosidase (family GH31 glycosyl hydrolase)
MLDVLHANTTFDGLWIDMNEITSFCNGECGF